MLVSQVVDRLNTELARTRLDVGRSLSSATSLVFFSRTPTRLVPGASRPTDLIRATLLTSCYAVCLPCHVLLLWMTCNSNLAPLARSTTCRVVVREKLGSARTESQVSSNQGREVYTTTTMITTLSMSHRDSLAKYLECYLYVGKELKGNSVDSD